MIVLGSQRDFLAVVKRVTCDTRRSHLIESFGNPVFSGDRRAPDHAAILSITNDMPEAGGGGASAGTDAPATAASDDDGGDGDGEDDCRRSRKHPSKGHAPHSRGTARTGTRKAAETSPIDLEIALWRLPTVLQHVPISRSGWWAGVKTGRYPAPVRIGAKAVAWRATDIRALVASL